MEFSTDRNYEMVTLPGQGGSNYQTLTRGRDTTESKYMTIGSCKMQAQDFDTESNDAPAVPPRPPIEYEYCSAETPTIHAVEEPKKKKKKIRCRNKAFMILGALVAVAFLLSAASVLSTVFAGSNGTSLESLQQSMQNSSTVIADQIERVKILESAQQPTNNNISLLLSRVSALERNVNDFNTTFVQTIDSVQSSLTDTSTRLINIDTRLNSTSSALHATDNRLNAASSDLRNLRNRLNAASSDLSNLRNRLSATSSDLRDLRTSLRSVNIFRCSREVSTCIVSQHPNAPWFLCATPSRRISRPGYYTVSMHCAYRLTTTNFIDQATLRTSAVSVWCECDVIGVTRGGHFGTFSSTIPDGRCVLTVTRCPTSSNILS